MSQENVGTIVRRGYDAFNRGDIEGVTSRRCVLEVAFANMSERVFNPCRIHEGHDGHSAIRQGRSMRSWEELSD